MSERPSSGIGKRLAKYRKLAGLSARELSDKIGGELSRGVIANIESGRKTDVTIDQLVSLSWALGVPPVVLALPVDEPYKFVRVIDTEDEMVASRAFRLMSWFQNEKVVYEAPRDSTLPDTPAGALAQELIKGVREYPKIRDSYARVKVAGGPPEQLRERELELLDHERLLRQLGVDVQMFKSDD